MSSGPPPNPPTLRDYLEAQSVRYVLALRGGGLTEAQIVERLQGRHPEMHINTARAIVRRAAQAASASEWLSILPNAPLDAGDLPRPLTGQTGYRYTAVIRWVTGQGHVEHMPWVITSRTNLTGNQARQAVLAGFNQQFQEQPSNRNPNYDLTHGVQDVEVIITGVERAIPD